MSLNLSILTSKGSEFSGSEVRRFCGLSFRDTLQKDTSMKQYYEINVIIYIKSYKSNLHYFYFYCKSFINFKMHKEWGITVS